MSGHTELGRGIDHGDMNLPANFKSQGNGASGMALCNGVFSAWKFPQEYAVRIVSTAELPPPPPGEEISAPVKTEFPKSFALEQNYPNPFNPTTELKYALPVDAAARGTIYNTLG